MVGNPAGLNAADQRMLLQQDPDIEQVVAHCKFVVTYFMEQDANRTGWRKSDIEGPVVIVRRRTAPRYVLIVKNSANGKELRDAVHPDWELDCQEHYVFFKVEDAGQRIRGLWFDNDNDRIKLEQVLERIFEELRNPPPVDTLPSQRQDLSKAAPGLGAPPARDHSKPQNGHQLGIIESQTAPSQLVITKDSLRASILSLADDDQFLDMIMQRLQNHST